MLQSLRALPTYYRWTLLGLAAFVLAAVQVYELGEDLRGLGGAERFRLVWRDDPATTMTIGWDQTDGGSPVVHYGPTDHGRDWTKYPHSRTPDRVEHFKGMANHFARLEGLAPDTAYFFVIKDDSGVSERLWFRTAPDTPKPFTFISGGDIRSWPESGPAKNANAMVNRLRPLFILFVGDYTTDGDEPFHDNDDEWRWFFDDWQLTRSQDGRMYPVIPCIGNHERTTEVLYRLFDLPHPENFQALSVGGDMLRVYALNSFLDKAPSQQAWLEADLAAHAPRFTLVGHHTPMFPHTTAKREYVECYEAWAELFYEHGVDLVAEGHAHVHKITYPVRPANGVKTDAGADAGAYQGFALDFERGMVFMGEGSWGSRPRRIDDPKPWTLDMASLYQFKWVHAYPDHLEVRTVLTQNPGAVERLTEADVFRAPHGLTLRHIPNHGDHVRIPMEPLDVRRRYER